MRVRACVRACVCVWECHQPRSANKSDRTFVWPLNHDHPSESSFSFSVCGDISRGLLKTSVKKGRNSCRERGEMQCIKREKTKGLKRMKTK